MKKNNIFIATVVTFLFALAACNSNGKNPRLPKMTTEEDSLNYSYGLFNGSQIKMILTQNGDSVDYRIDQFMDGARSGLAGSPDEIFEFVQIGNQMGAWLNQQEKVGFLGDSTLELNYELVKQGVINSIKGEKTQMTTEEAQRYVDSAMSSRQK